LRALPPFTFIRRSPLPSLRLRLSLLLPAAALAVGCSYMQPRVHVQDLAVPALAVHAAPAGPAQGAIFQAASYRPLFEDHRARLVGDTLVVRIVERVSASQKNTSSVDRAGSTSATVSAIPGVRPVDVARARLGAETGNSFSGKGATETSNDFTGTITVTVRAVLPNGHLLIAGEKQIGVNANVDVLRFSGQVDPRAIQPGNTVQSVQIANVRLEQRGRGAQADAQAMGWLQRVFMSVLPV
jgi:flagellar L-ring protein precursor FlgH